MSHRSLAELVARLVAAEAARKALLSPDEHDFGFPREIVDEPVPEPPRADKDAAGYAADALEDFNWHHTIEGPEYWRDVHARLTRIAEEGR